MSTHRRLAWIGLASLSLLAAACGGAGGGAGSTPTIAAPSATTDPSAASQVPASIKAKGTLNVASDATYAPDEFIASDGKTVVGMDADLATAIGQVLGLRVDIVNRTFNTIIPGIQSGKYDMSLSSFTDSKAREKVVDFVTYFTSGTSFYVKASGGPNIQSLSDLCGRTVAVESGTTEETDAKAQDATCKQQGKPGVTVQAYPDQNATNLAVSSGRAEVGMADSPIAAYQVKLSNGVFKVSGPSYGNAPYGIAVAKGSGMAQAVLAAVKDLMSNGVYAGIMQKWGTQAGAITNPTVNGAIS